MRRRPSLRLEPVTNVNWRDGLAVRAQAGQARFVANYEPVLLVILAKSAVRVGGVEWWPYLLADHEGSTVGVVAVADHREHDGALVIFHLLIDARHQRRGYGRAALHQIIELGLQAEGCLMVRLSVNPHNAAAIALYSSEGFQVTGTDADGELEMAKPL